MSKYARKKENMYFLDTVRNSMILPNALRYKEQNLDLSPLQIISKKKMMDLDKAHNHKIYEDEVQEVSEIICQGFEAVYKEVEENKGEYEKFFDECFKDVSVRYLNKTTNEYSNIKNLLYNPVCLYDSQFAFAVTSRLFDKKTNEIPYEELIEQKEVLMLNIPYFEVMCNKKDLILYNGCTIKDYFVESPLEGVAKKLEVLGEKDFKRQLTIVRRSFEVISSEFEVRELCDVKDIKSSDDTISKISMTEAIDIFLDTSINRIFKEKLIHPFNGQYFWMDPMLHGDNETGEDVYMICDVPNSYYGGNVGILTVLLNLNNWKVHRKKIEKLRADIDDEIKRVLSENDTAVNIGSYNGVTSYIRYYLNLYRHNLISEDQLMDLTKPIINQIEKSYTKDSKLDILDGSAGVILTLVELYNISSKKSKDILELLSKLRKHIIARIVYQGEDAYFPLENRSGMYYSGYAHGSCGIITALYKVNRLLEIEGQELIIRLLRTERKMYDPKRRIWNRDNRKLDYSWGWCHGIPGILLSRIELYKAGYRDEYIYDEMKELYDISIDKSLGSNLTLCHGDLSNIVICRYAAEVLGLDNHSIKDYVNEMLPIIVDSANRRIRGTEAVGLMSGIMGISLFLDNVVINDNDVEIIRALTGI